MAELVSVELIKKLGRIDTTEHDDILLFLQVGAQEFVEDYCALALDQEDHEDELITADSYYLRPRFKPIVSVASILDTWNDDEPVTCDYNFDQTKIFIPGNGVWGQGEKRYKVTYTAGYADDAVPNAINSAIAQLVIRNYDNTSGLKSGTVTELSSDWQALMDSDITAMLSRHTFRRVMS